jgi:flagella basal body P-ring formation protein FlgA
MMMVIPALLALAVIPEGCHLIQSDIIFARDVAAVVPAFAGISGDFNLGYVPSSGEPRILRGVDLQRIAKNQRLELDGLPDVCFARETFVPQPEQLREAMLTELNRSELNSAELNGAEPKLDGVKIEILSWSQQPSPVGELVFPRDGMQLPQGIGTSRDFLWHGYVRYGDQHQFPVWAKVRITANITRVVAAGSLSIGKPIQASQVRLERCEDFPFDETVARNLDEVIGYLSRRSVRGGSVIHKTQIELAPDVARGDVIIVEVFVDGAHLKLEGRAESTGIKGSTILVRNLSSGKDFPAQVTGKHQATVGMAPGDTPGLPGLLQ